MLWSRLSDLQRLAVVTEVGHQRLGGEITFEDRTDKALSVMISRCICGVI